MVSTVGFAMGLSFYSPCLQLGVSVNTSNNLFLLNLCTSAREAYVFR